MFAGTLEHRTMKYTSMNEMDDFRKKSIETMSYALQQFAAATAHYSELKDKFLSNVRLLLSQIAYASVPFVVIRRLGEVQYVAWKNFTKEFYDQAYETKTKDELLHFITMWNERDDHSEAEDTINKLFANKDLKDNPFFIQSVNAYKRTDYNLASLGITAMVDKLLSQYSGKITNTNFQKRINALINKIEKNGESSLDDLEMDEYILITTYSKALELFVEDCRFDQDEPELNRHWIAHGRMERTMNQMDCIMLINFLYGTILINQLAAGFDGRN